MDQDIVKIPCRNFLVRVVEATQKQNAQAQILVMERACAFQMISKMVHPAVLRRMLAQWVHLAVAELVYLMGLCRLERHVVITHYQVIVMPSISVMEQATALMRYCR
jgi:hypothetical protein